MDDVSFQLMSQSLKTIIFETVLTIVQKQKRNSLLKIQTLTFIFMVNGILTNIHRSGGEWWGIFTGPRSVEVNIHHTHRH